MITAARIIIALLMRRRGEGFGWIPEESNGKGKRFNLKGAKKGGKGRKENGGWKRDCGLRCV
jgi:hypothetical protein